MTTSTLVHCGVGLLTILISVPLILRKVPMNHLYGIRISKAFTSDRYWYDINAYGGKLLLAFGLFLSIFGITADNWAPTSANMLQVIFIVGPILLIIPVFLMILAYAKSLPE
jgi:hypothetical protein